MKTIANTQTTIPAGEGRTLTVADLLKAALNQTPQGGFDLATMRARLRVAEAADKAKPGEGIALEPADYHTAKQAVAAMRWGAMHPDILTFSEAFEIFH